MKELIPKKIIAENAEYIYYGRDDGIPHTSDIRYLDGGEIKTVELGWYSESLPIMERFLPESPDVRLVLIPNFFHPETADAQYLYWNTGGDLNMLDSKVDQGTYSDEDFQKSIMTHYNKTKCLDCGRTWDTLVADPSNPYGAPGLLQKKMDLYPTLRCPNCGAFFRIYVVKVFL